MPPVAYTLGFPARSDLQIAASSTNPSVIGGTEWLTQIEHPEKLYFANKGDAMFEEIEPGPEDPMFHLKKDAEADTSPNTVDIGVGIYRNESGLYQELDVVKEAKKRLDQLSLGHDYGLTTGDDEFLRLAAQVMFGEKSELLSQGLISSVQAISGSGANHLAAHLLSHCINPHPKVFVATPTWSNTIPMFEHLGLETVTYPYVDEHTRLVDVQSCLNVMRNAPKGSVFVFQGCCHNPLGTDLTTEMWSMLSHELKVCGHLPIIDIAYQGLGDGLDEDAAGVRILADAGIEMLVCQSFSKNFALYGERCGALHVVAKSATAAENVRDQLRSLIRREYSSAPAYGARIVKIVLEDEELKTKWCQEVAAMRDRLHRNRRLLHGYLSHSLKTPGSWDHILLDKGLFSRLALTPVQCADLIAKHHVHLPRNGRINIAGLNLGNVEYTARAIDAVVRSQMLGSDCRL